MSMPKEHRTQKSAPNQVQGTKFQQYSTRFSESRITPKEVLKNSKNFNKIIKLPTSTRRICKNLNFVHLTKLKIDDFLNNNSQQRTTQSEQLTQ